MAVYTHISDAEMSAFLARLNRGTLVRFEGIPQGVENTNYRVFVAGPDAVIRPLIVTIFEKRVAEADIPFYLAAMSHFDNHDLPTPCPYVDADGQAIQRLQGKTAIAISFLDGTPHMDPTPADCAAFGRTLARMHLAGAHFPHQRANNLSLDGWRSLAAACKASIHPMPDDLVPTIARELALFAHRWPSDLPRGLIHADAFPDNVFFDAGGEVSGVIDFYFACTDMFAYDLAITLNAWASPSGTANAGQWRAENARALIDGYTAIRPLMAAERAAMPILLRGAALRFLLTRLYDWLHQTPGAVVAVKDPYEYARLIHQHASGETALV